MRISSRIIGNKTNTACENYNRYQWSLSESQKEHASSATSFKRVAKSKHCEPHNVDEEDKSTAIPNADMTYKDAIDPTR